ncbi:MAG: HEPN domain-containing protein [Armatimonadetes bacterium]|nr:HEPN domain-containing protein [Armatimonadota bacterium]
MSEPSRELLIACSLTTGSERERFGGAIEIDLAVKQAAVDRLLLAEEFLASAGEMLSSGRRDVDYRNSISRAYYACHHAIRALSLHKDRQDRYGHDAAIEYLAEVAKSKSRLRARVGEAQSVMNELTGLMDARHLADYHPYGTDKPRKKPCDFAAEASSAIATARKVVGAIKAYIAEEDS